MASKFNSNRQKTSTQPYDSRISEPCAQCSGDIIYRKSSYFGNKVYYKVCKNCGWYKVLPREEWLDVVHRDGEEESAHIDN